MPDLNPNEVERYLRSVLGTPATVLGMIVLGSPDGVGDIKNYGYGTPVKVDYQADGERRSAVLHTVRPGPFGHQHMADRAQELLWAHQAFNHLPRHVRSLDVCGFEPGGQLVSAGKAEEFCLLTEYVEGESYSRDLERLRDTDQLTQLDLARTDAASLLEKIEQMAVSWRWRLKDFPHRLRQVHGDFHPWNILFRSQCDFSVLDRSRGEYGDPADDVTSLTLNYAFYSLQRSGRLEGDLKTLFLRFWDRYLEKSADGEALKVAAPFLAFRGLVMASPVWYPTLPKTVRQKILTFTLAVLESDEFDPRKTNDYCES